MSTTIRIGTGLKWNGFIFKTINSNNEKSSMHYY